ncbi:MAG: DUF1553 domain-containing protein [Planctomycetota bacterium]|nr:MAG: DUF1553 domain-containing protein [Planctomycetota bacterium]REK49242.1 MAG: DUF1553 domain-containing protein [Planctomycetota bacterium]
MRESSEPSRKGRNVAVVIRLVLRVITLCGVFAAILGPRLAFAKEPTAAAHFDERVAPLLTARCLECHAGAGKGGLDLASRAGLLAGGESGEVIVAGEADASLLIERVAAGEMPPENPLSEQEVATLRRWVELGAYFPEQPIDPLARTTDKRAGYDWWSLQPLTAVEPPAVATTSSPGADWQSSAIDRFVLARLQEANLEPSPPATPRVLIRRATYDLWGLPPEPAEVEAFAAACAHETGSRDQVGQRAYAALIDRLLASPHYGEQWGRHWLDVVRFGESTGFEQNRIINNAWPFRDYIIRSLNDDKPFDRLITEHLAGDMLGPEDAQVSVGTTFLVCGPYDTVGNQDPVRSKQIRANTVDEIIRATGETFLGLTFGCGRCHDHKFDPISQRDYYQLYATFDGVFHSSRVVGPRDKLLSYLRRKRSLEKVRADLTAKKAEIEKAVLARAEEKAAEYEQAWTREPASQQLTEEGFEPVEARFVRLVVERVDANVYMDTYHRIDEFEVWTSEETPRNVALASRGATAQGSSKVAQDFMAAYDATLTIDGDYTAWYIATSPELTIELARPEVIDRVTFSSDRANVVGSQGRQAFPCEYRIEVSDDGTTWQEVANSHDRRPVNQKHRNIRLFLAERSAEESILWATHDAVIGDVDRRLARLPRPTSWWVGEFRQPKEHTFIMLGGDVTRHGDQVTAASPRALRDVAPYRLADDAREGERRLALARWLVADDNPLTPRVLANRLWHYHFGTGIVATPSDFGFMGDRPSHPELLDWLALQLKENGWRLKPLHREIMLSQAYRQSSVYRQEAAAVDADARLLWRFPPRRLEGEEIRDTFLAMAGKLDKRMGGPGFKLYRYLQDNVSTYVPRDKHPPETYRRAVYHQKARASHVDLVTDFDSPDCAFSTPRRSSTTSPLQALTLLNHSFTLDMAGFMAERLQQEAGSEVEQQVCRGFQVALAREPSTEELAAATAVAAQHGLPAFCRALLNSSELIFLD